MPHERNTPLDVVASEANDCRDKRVLAAPVDLTTADIRVAEPPGGALRIALVHTADRGGGAEQCVMTLHKSLLELGHQSRLFVGSKHTDAPEVFEIPRDRPIPGILRMTRWLETKRGWQAVYAPWFRSLHRLIGEADILHLNSLWGGQFGYADLTGIASLSQRYPTLMTLHDAWMSTGHCACPIGCDRWMTGCGSCPDLKRVPTVERDATRWNWTRKRRAVQGSPLRVSTVSHWLKSQVEHSPIFAGKRIDVVYNSVDESAFCPGDKQQSRQPLGLPPDEFLVLLAGQSVEWSRFGIAQHAVAALNRLGRTDLTPLIIGRYAAEVAQALTIPSRKLPYQTTHDGMAACYRAADITVVPSEYETFGRVAAESLMCGTPVVAFRTGGLPEVVTDGVNGRIVPSGDVEALAAAIAEMRDIPGRRDEFAKAAKAAAAKFSRARIAQNYVRLYRDTMTV